MQPIRRCRFVLPRYNRAELTLHPDNPITVAPQANEDWVMEIRKQNDAAMRRAPSVIQEAYADFTRVFGRKYGNPFFEEYETDDADIVLFGMGTMSMLWPILDSNKQTLDYTSEDIMTAIKGDAIICACINANGPLRDMTNVLRELKDMGVFSVSNIGPSISYVDKDSEIYRVMTKSGITLDNEIEMLKLGREMDMVTVGLAFDEEDSLRMIEEAQPDIFCFHAGTTKGGLKGYDSGETIDETAARTEEVNAKARALKPDIMLIAHGAAMETPEDAEYILHNTTCDGIWTGSSTERIPIERAVSSMAKKFADLRFKE